MQIDLTNPADFTIVNVRRLLASKDDSEHRLLYVTRSGNAFLGDFPQTKRVDEIKFRFESWAAGNGYCGTEAAGDPGYAERIYGDLKVAWENDLEGHIDCEPEALL